MRIVTKFLCLLSITVLLVSCASSGSGCYDFGDNSKSKKDIDNLKSEIVFVSNGINKLEGIPTICED